MKKMIALLALAITMTACGTEELEEINQGVEVKAAKDDKKQDPNFRIFNDRIQTGKK